MLTKLTIRNFKRFEEAVIELGNPVVFIGPNDSGKTTALQALALWSIGVRRWKEKLSGRTPATKRPGVAINRRDLLTVPVPAANLLWRDLHVRNVRREDGGQKTTNVLIDILVEGVSKGQEWKFGLEFYYANVESFYCRPMSNKDGRRMDVPLEAGEVRIAFLPPMSGLAPQESRLDLGAINVHLGEGRTAEVLRNLCFQIVSLEGGNELWKKICDRIEDLFGIKLGVPTYISERGEITLSYRNRTRVVLDLSASGRGLQQTLLLLAHLVINPKSILLLDEPDAHLEILRQRQTYQLLVDTAREHGSQIIAASHSEVVLNEAADRDVVIAFVGKPHRIDDRGSQALKALKEIGFDQFYQAEQMGWVLYVEGATDLAILQALSKKLHHPAQKFLDRPFVRYVGNQPNKAESHFFGLREASPNLVGFALFDQIDQQLQIHPALIEYKWSRREIENYLCSPDTLCAFAESLATEASPGPLFTREESEKRRKIMDECIADLAPPVALRDPSDRWWIDTKISDDFLDRLFPAFFKKLHLPNLMNKTDYHVLAQYVPENRIDQEVGKVLESIIQTAHKAHGSST
ncbi:MAG: AAA family ATPase [Acidobacteria bacterium RIFCSPLOWO2_12_FULL_54_10]|nr:MAG: AAA family ATPase [Acidobacteria bacterium RIFCSPLOWO2_12_FULL_54_10]